MVVDIDPVIMIVVTKRQKDKNTKGKKEKKGKKKRKKKGAPTPSAGARTSGPAAPEVLVYTYYTKCYTLISSS